MTQQPALPPGRGSQLTPTERAEIQSLYLLEDLSQSEIARRVGRDRETVRNVMRAEDTRALADQLAADARDTVIQTLRRAAPRMAQHWMDAAAVAKDRGDHRPARDLLLHVGAIEPVVGAGGTGSRVTIVVGMPGRPAGEPGAVTIDVSAEAASEPEAEQ